MGIRFIDSLLSLLVAACGVFTAYLVGHALSSDHAGWAWITAGALLLATLLLGAFTVRRIRKYGASRPSHTHTH